MPTGQPVPQPYYNSHALYPTHSQPQDQNKPPNHPSNFPPSLTKQSIQTKSPYAPMYISTPVNTATPAKLKTVATYYQGCFTDEELFLGVKVGNGYSRYDKPENIEMEAPIIEKAKKGDAEALYQFGKKYNSTNAVRAMAWFQKAAAAAGNHSAAQLEIGKLYVSSHRGIDADGALAKEWLMKAHQNGEKDAALQLGDMYHLGKIVPKDYKLAMEWYLKSPDTECITLLARIGIMYKKGHGVPKDENTAQEYFTRASQIGHFDAANQLGKILDSSQEMGDREEAMKWYKEGYFQGSDDAAIRLHEIYDSDPKYMNTKDAAEWFYRGTYSDSMDRDDNEKILRRMSHFLSASSRCTININTWDDLQNY
jgi:TPR repeat protein